MSNGDDLGDVADDLELSALEEEFGTFIDPLQAAAESQWYREALLRNMGWNPDAFPLDDIPDAFDQVADAFDTLIGLVDDPPETIPDFVEALVTVGELIAAIDDITTAVAFLDDLSVDEAEQFGIDLISTLVVNYLQERHPVLARLAILLTVVREADPEAESDITHPDGSVVRAVGPDPDLALEDLGELFSDPASFVVEGYFGENGLDTVEAGRDGMELLLPHVASMLTHLGVRAYASIPEQGETPTDTPLRDKLASFDLGDELGTLSVVIDVPADGLHFGIHLVVYFDEASAEISFGLVPTGSGSFTDTIGSSWSLSVDVSAEAAGVAITPGGVEFESASASEVDITARLERLGELDASTDDGDGSGRSPAFVLGGADSTRLEIGSLSVEGSSTISQSTQTADVLAKASDSTFVLRPADAGGFIKTVFPGGGIEADFDLGIGWATDRGVYLDGSYGGLESSLDVNLSLGEVLSIDTINIAVVTTAGDVLPLQVGTNATVGLGPMQATVKDIGLELPLTFPAGNDGNLGPVDVGFGFKPPTGVGLSIDGGPIRGGGFLEFDHENERYAGVLQLQIAEVTISAIGLITTRLPDGSDGFSLLVIISGEFPPVQLGFGFTLNGLGGLLGLHRTMKTGPLRGAVRRGHLDSIMFPEDPVANANRIISDLRAIFPPRSDLHVFGPMARLGWGTPTLIRADLGVILQLPVFKIAILGRLSMNLPDEDAALVAINMDVLGMIDPPAQRASMFAALFDSRIVQWTVSGQMAMVSRWGDDPRFVLSVGGFNPRYDPPADFPALERVTVSLDVPGGNPQLVMTGYLATTSNTFQVGANVDAKMEAGPIDVSGQLGFDALFHFDPFRFIIDFVARLRACAAGTCIGVSVDGTLKGPSPLSITGKVSIDLLLIEVSGNIDVEIGPEPDPEPLPRAEILPELVAELGTPRNWSAQLPAGGETLVSLREIDSDDGEVLAHPLGTLAVRQTVVPLDDFRIEKFGNARPTTHDRFSITSITADDEELDGEDIDENFAPAQFRDMKDSEKLSSPAFEKQAAGRKLGNDLLTYVGEESGHEDLMAAAPLEYETSVVDREHENDGVSLGTLGRFAGRHTEHSFATKHPRTVERLAEINRARNAIREEELGIGRKPDPKRRFGDGEGPRFSAPVDVEDAVDPERTYDIVYTSDLTPADLAVERAGAVGPESRMTRTEAESTLRDHLAITPQDAGRVRVVSADKVILDADERTRARAVRTATTDFGTRP